jgi:glucose-6-phosphate dehydrogenase-like protein OpcA
VANTLTEDWTGVDCSLGDVESALAQLRESAAQEGGPPSLRTSVMTHLVWAPEEWLDRARQTLAGMAERHPSRTIFLVPDPDAGEPAIDATVTLECYSVEGMNRQVCSEVVQLRLRGTTAKAPASVVEPLLISDLPVFCRWRGQPPFGAVELDQLVDVADRLIVDSTEWDDLPYAYGKLAGLLERTAVSDIAWARTERWRRLLASLWPGIAGVGTVRVHGTAAQAYLLVGWLRSRLDREIDLDHVEAERLEGVDLDGEPAPFPPGDPPLAPDVLSEELEKLSRDPAYEDAVRAASQLAQ